MQHSIINSTPTSFFFSLTFPARTCNPMTTTRRLGMASFPDFPAFTCSCPIIPAASLVRSLLAVVFALRPSPFHLEGPLVKFTYFVCFSLFQANYFLDGTYFPSFFPKIIGHHHACREARNAAEVETDASPARKNVLDGRFRII